MLRDAPIRMKRIPTYRNLIPAFLKKKCPLLPHVISVYEYNIRHFTATKILDWKRRKYIICREATYIRVFNYDFLISIITDVYAKSNRAKIRPTMRTDVSSLYR